MFATWRQHWRSRFEQRYQRWIEQRLPAARQTTLDQRSIFIFPSRVGLALLGFNLVMLLVAINYQNSMAFALVFLLFSLFIVSVLHTYANLSGLTVQVIKADNGFAGDTVPVTLAIFRNGERTCHDVVLYWPATEPVMVSLLDRSDQRVVLHLPTRQRGLLKPGRLHIETVYPLGLLKAWSRPALQIEAVVYPSPLADQRFADLANGGEEGELLPVSGSDDFYALNSYRAGDSLKHIYWKHYAREQGLYSKQFAAFREQQLWLDWQQFSGSIEQRLAKLCYWILMFDRQDVHYGLRLPGSEFAPGRGDSHRQRLLTALALYPDTKVRSAVE